MFLCRCGSEGTCTRVCTHGNCAHVYIRVHTLPWVLLLSWEHLPKCE